MHIMQRALAEEGKASGTPWEELQPQMTAIGCVSVCLSHACRCWHVQVHTHSLRAYAFVRRSSRHLHIAVVQRIVVACSCVVPCAWAQPPERAEYMSRAFRCTVNCDQGPVFMIGHGCVHFLVLVAGPTLNCSVC